MTETEKAATARRLYHLAARAGEILGSAEAGLVWLDSPNVALGGVSPRQMVIDGPDRDEPARALQRMAAGVYG